MENSQWYACFPLLTINDFIEARSTNSSFVPSAWFGMGQTQLKAVFGDVSLQFPLSKDGLEVLETMTQDKIVSNLEKFGAV